MIVDGIKILLLGGSGAIGGLLRFAMKHYWHQYLPIRVIVGGFFIALGYALMALLAIGYFIYMASMMSHSKIESPISFLQLLALIVLGSAGYAFAYIGRSFVRTPAQKILAQAKDHYVLYLRSFFDDGIQLKQDGNGKNSNVIFTSMFQGFKGIVDSTKDFSFEGNLTKAIKEKVGPVIAVGKPGDTLPPPTGASRLWIAANDWQNEVKKLIQNSKLVLITLGTGGGLLWEINQVLIMDAQKLLVAIPPLDNVLLKDRLQVLQTI